MKTYLVKTPVPGVNGENAGIFFNRGQALVTVDLDASPNTNPSLAAMRYFVEAGYLISDADGSPIEQAELHADLGLPAPINRAAAAQVREVEALRARRDQLKGIEELDELRAEVEELEKAAADRAAEQAEADAEAAARAAEEAKASGDESATGQPPTGAVTIGDPIPPADDPSDDALPKASKGSTAKGGGKNG